VRNPHGAVAVDILRAGEANICTSIIVAAQLRFGAEKKGSRKRMLLPVTTGWQLTTSETFVASKTS
jgi:predicted nucleic acid-binding protein